MTDVPDWDHDDPLDVWRPTPGELASTGELWQYCLAVDDPRFNAAFNTICDGVLLEKNLPRVLAAVLLHGRDLLEGNCADQELARVRLATSVDEARGEAIREAAYRDYT